MATGLNNLGQVVGFSDTDSSETSPSHAFLWDQATGMHDLGTLGGPVSRAYGINDSGQVVGFSLTDDFRQLAFRWDPAEGMTPLESPGGTAEAHAINGIGVMVGLVNSRPVRWLPGQAPQELGPVVDQGAVVSVNASGWIAGASDEPGYPNWLEAVLWRPDGGMMPLGTFGDFGSEARWINVHGDVVGVSGYALWDPSVGVLWPAGGGMVDLNTCVPGGWSVQEACGINARGDIVANGFDGSEYQACVLWRQGPAGVVSSETRADRLRIYPNPTAGGLSLDFESSTPGQVRVEVFDASGRLADSFAGLVSAGPVTLPWPAKHRDAVKGLPAGLYAVRVLPPVGAALRGRFLLLPRR